MEKIFLKKNEDRRIKKGHLWIFSNEIQKVEGEPSNGDLVSVIDSHDKFVCAGFYNANSLITVRIFSFNEKFNFEGLLKSRLKEAYKFRKTVYPSRDSFRMVFSESDFLPGLIIDKYNDTFVLQVYSAGIEKNIDAIINILKDEFDAQNIFTKNEEYFRTLEGLSTDDSVYLGKQDEEIISDGNVKYKINFATGHKTGFYFDQCDNRNFVEQYCKGKTVLDCFCNSGGFGLHAAYAGADEVVFVDSSGEEIQNAENNFSLNGFNCKSQFVRSDVFDYLEDCIIKNKKFDIVILDPPAFAKNKKSLIKAVKGYEKLNRLGMEIMNERSMLFTSSCSHHLKEEIFLDTLNIASSKAGKKTQLFKFNNASMDHPKLLSMEETVYLKFAALKVSLK